MKKLSIVFPGWLLLLLVCGPLWIWASWRLERWINYNFYYGPQVEQRLKSIEQRLDNLEKR